MCGHVISCSQGALSKEDGERTLGTRLRNASLAISLFLSCFSCREGENYADENINGIVEYSE